MSFSPLPTDFLQCLQNLHSRPDHQILDLGSGGGFFASELGSRNLKVWGLDLMPPESGAKVDIRADALWPPLLPGSLDLLLAGNLIHHLLAQEPSLSFIEKWLGLLKPGGWLFLFGDQPEPGEDPAATNYRRLQEFLADLMPDRRGALVSLSSFLEKVSGLVPGLAWQCGLQANDLCPDTDSVREMLNGNTVGRPPAILEAIEKSGLSYGQFWWVSAQRGLEG